ncbi:unnamed protein product [Spirodela intermedia]|uniref:Uncharacterized protein n=1 Tax=Spirodela intermedia TaxID=51605 RepID=A0A7I8L9I5_SPIIN|nr:unnamed protein product [Spirodela intermedia]
MDVPSTTNNWKHTAVFSPPTPGRPPPVKRKRWAPSSSPRRGCRCSGGSRSGAYESNVLLSAAAKRGPLDGALQLFFLLRDRDTVTWNTAISACLRHRRPRAALELFAEMLLSGRHPPDSITLRSALRACADMEELELLSQIHGYITKIEAFPDEDMAVLYTCMVDLYWELGNPKLARQLFDGISHKDVVAFTSMMTNCSRAGEYEEALRIFREMVEGGYAEINGYALSAALRACAGLLCESSGRQVHAGVIKSSLGSDVVVGTALVDLYSKCGDMTSAKSAFSSISEPNTAAWNALMDGCSMGGHEAVRLFSRMRLKEVNLDRTTLAIVLRACRDSSLRTIQQLHGLILKESTGSMDSYIGTALFQNYLACGCFHHARKLFDEIPGKDSVHFNLGISEYAQRGHLEEAVDLLFGSIEAADELNGGAITPLVSAVNDLKLGRQFHGLATKFGLDAGSNELLGSALISMYMKFRCQDEATQLFHDIDSPDVVSWTCLISGLSKIGETREGLNLYFKMVSEGSLLLPNYYTFSCLLRACASLLAVEEGKQIHAQLIKSHPSPCDAHVLNSLLDMYAKCGYIAEAKDIFKRIKEPDLAVWNAMIHGLARHGFADETMELFHELLAQRDLKPNNITFLGVLSACAHGGLVEEGYRWFRSIERPSVDHYSCMINMVARAGRLKEATGLLREMPFEPNEYIWASLLAASCVHQDPELGQYSAKRLLELNPRDAGAYIALSNLYAAASQWSEVKRLRKMMREQGIRKGPGLSWLRVSQASHVFVAGEDAHHRHPNRSP